jgi:hypothetical protein
LLLGPTDKLVSGFEVQGRSAPSRYGQPLAFPNHGVTQLLADQLRTVQVMLLDQNLIALPEILGVDQQLHGDFP